MRPPEGDYKVVTPPTADAKEQSGRPEGHNDWVAPQTNQQALYSAGDSGDGHCD